MATNVRRTAAALSTTASQAEDGRGALCIGRRRALALAGALAAVLASSPLWAAESDPFPSGSITIVVPFAPGGAADTAARVIAPKLGEALQTSVVVENRPGAGGSLGAGTVAKAKPDGHTLLMGSAANAIAVSLHPDLPFDFGQDFVPVIQVADVPGVLVVHPSLPVNNVQELVAYLKTRPGELSYGSAGVGTSIHLAGEMLKQAAGVDIVHLPYRGAPQALVDLIAGRLQLMFPAAAAALPHIQDGKLRALAVTAGKRSTLLPELPTVAEAGLPGYAVGGWIGLFAPANTPPEAVAQLQDATAKVLAMPEILNVLTAQGMEPVGGTSASFADLTRAEIARWGEVVRAGNIKAE